MSALPLLCLVLLSQFGEARMLKSVQKKIMKQMEENEKRRYFGTEIKPGVHISRYFNYVDSYNENRETVMKVDYSRLREELDENVMPFVHSQKMMFAVQKGMMHNKYVEEGDFKTSKAMLERAYPEGLPYKIDLTEMNRLNCMSMAKDIYEWDRGNQPVGGSFPEYASVAKLTATSLPVVRHS